MLRNIKRVIYEEIPTIWTTDEGQFYASSEVRLLIIHNNEKQSKLCIPKIYLMNSKKYHLSPYVFSVYDMLAFFIFKYFIDEHKSFEFNLLYKLIHQSNGFSMTIKKFSLMLMKYFVFNLIDSSQKTQN
mgnify:CR=1 FL=1